MISFTEVSEFQKRREGVMCYSAMIEADLRTLESRFGAKIDLDSLEQAFYLRDNHSSANIPAAIDTYIIQNAKTPREKKLANMAKEHYQKEIEKFSAKKEKYEKDVLQFEAKIEKGSKAKDLPEKLEKRKQSVEHLKRKISYYEKIEEQGAARVFPNFYAPTIVSDKGQKWIRLMRYHICPQNGKELLPFRYNLYNARRDRILESRTWKPIFGKKHAIFPFHRFYESVEGEKGEIRIIYFTQKNEELMWAASIYETTKTEHGILNSFAAVTDDPPPEVAATGHDRCPIFIDESKIESWLAPEDSTAMDLFNLLGDVTATTFKHFDADSGSQSDS